jgi:hypothetical protein
VCVCVQTDKTNPRGITKKKDLRGGEDARQEWYRRKQKVDQGGRQEGNEVREPFVGAYKLFGV